MPRVNRARMVAMLGAGWLLVACGAAPQTQTPSQGAHKGGEELREQGGARGTPSRVTYSAVASADSQRDIEAAVTLAESGKRSEALAKLEEVAARDAQAFLAHYNLGVLHDYANQRDKARASYEKALQIEPDYSPALLNWVRVEVRSNAGARALELADRYIAQRPENLSHQFARLEALLASGRNDEVLRQARELLRRDETSARLRYYMAAAEYAAKRYRLAAYIIEGAIEIQDDDPEVFYLQGLIWLALDAPLDARLSLERAVSLRAEFPEAQVALGQVYYETRNFEEAEAAFLQALRSAPEMREAYLNLGNALKAQGRGDEAEAAFLRALELSPSWGDAAFSLGSLYLAQEVIELSKWSGLERLEEALRMVERARSLWRDADALQMADEFLTKVNTAIVIKKAELEAAPSGSDDPFGGDPFGDDPFGDDAFGDDPFGDDASGDDPFGDSEDDAGVVDENK